MNALTKTVKRIAGALTPTNVEAVRGNFVTRKSEVEAAQRALDASTSRRKAAIENDAPDAEIDAIEAEIKAAESALSRAQERLQVAADRLERAEAEAKEASGRAARKAHADHLEASAATALKTLHDAAFATLGAIRAIAQMEAESMRLAALAEVEQGETSVERAARLLDGGGIEKVVDSKEVELWTDRVGRVLPEQPSNISDYGDELVIPSPAGSRTPTSPSTFEVQRWRFQKERFYPRTGSSYVECFAESVVVPALAAGLPVIWEGPHHFKSDPSDLLLEIEQAFERLAAQRAQLIDKKPDRGELQERLIPIGQVPFEIARQKAKKADWVDRSPGPPCPQGAGQPFPDINQHRPFWSLHMHEQFHHANHASAHFKNRENRPRIALTICFGQDRYVTSSIRLSQARGALQVLQLALADADAFFNEARGTECDDDSQG